MKKKILLPTDFSRNSWTAITYASELYKNEECDFYLLHTFTTYNYTTDNMMVPEPGERFYDEEKANSELGLKKLLKQLEIREIPPNHTYFTHSVYNSVVEGIKDFVEAKDIELIVIGTKGETDAKETLYGSNAIDIMEKIRNCPVLIIPVGVRFKEPKEIVFPTSFKTHYKRRELKNLYEVAKITNAPIRILHISTEKKLTDKQIENRSLLEECLDGLIYTFHYIDDTDTKTGLRIFVESRGSEMIAFINKKHSFFGSIFSRPMVKDLGQHSKIPVLVMHDLRN